MNTGKKILVIDDDKSVLRTFTLILKKDDYDVDIAETGKEALKKAEAGEYDAALVDVRLPDMDGTDLLPRLQKVLPGAVKIIITGFPSLETGIKSLDVGADAYLVKPVRPEDLLVLIKEKIKSKKEARVPS
jgi:DNA-binding response OmpR family regulator